MKKKLIAITSVISLLAVAVFGGTMAYLTDHEDANNVFTVGNVDITLEEPGWETPDTVLPGIEYAKDPTVTNIGANDAYIRMHVTISSYSAFADAAMAHGLTDISVVLRDLAGGKWIKAGSPVADVSEDTVTYSYYYKGVLAPAGSTGALFTSVMIPSEFTSDDMAKFNDHFTIKVSADAIQADGFESEAAAFAAFDAAE